MIDHTTIAVKNIEESVIFYTNIFKSLQIDKVIDFIVYGEKRLVAYGRNNSPSFWVSELADPQFAEDKLGNAAGLTFVFKAQNVEEINEWYSKALELGALSKEEPMHKPYYHPGYYGASIIDINGWQLEAAIHNFEVN
jgi:catechol 2,3-dioxygenase-like lactoylglutathione lyase family enzyme